MKRGELYRVYRGNHRHTSDPRDFRVFVVLSRQTLIDSHFSTVICAPIYSHFDGLSTQIEVGVNEGLKKSSSIFCDELVSIEKIRLTDFVGSVAVTKLLALDESLKIALDIDR